MSHGRLLDRPVSPEVLKRVLSAALQAPSGGNLQSWRVYLLAGAKLDDLKDRIRRRIAPGDPGDQPAPGRSYSR
jgi:nitroreductase